MPALVAEQHPQKSPEYTQKSPEYPQKSLKHPQKGLFVDVNIRKRTPNILKRALHIHKRALMYYVPDTLNTKRLHLSQSNIAILRRCQTHHQNNLPTKKVFIMYVHTRTTKLLFKRYAYA